MAKPNFKYEKRQKELAKQKKAEEKRLKKLEKRLGGNSDSNDEELPVSDIEATDEALELPKDENSATPE